MAFGEFAVFGAVIIAAIGYVVYEMYSSRQSPYGTGSRSSATFRDPCVLCYVTIAMDKGGRLDCGHYCHEKCFNLSKNRCPACRTQ